MKEEERNTLDFSLQCRKPWFDSWVRKIHWRKDRLPVPGFLDFPGDTDGKESTSNVGDLGSMPGLGSPLEEGMASHSSILTWRIPMDKMSLKGYCPWVTNSQTWLSNLATQHSTVESVLSAAVEFSKCFVQSKCRRFTVWATRESQVKVIHQKKIHVYVSGLWSLFP